MNLPRGLAFDAAGNLYAANYGDNTIQKFTTGGARSVFASTGLSGPIGLAFDGAGNLYAANSGDNTIEKTHARIVLKNGRYLLVDADTPGGTYLNDELVTGPTPLRSGDVIRVGRDRLLRFSEKQKRR